MDFQKFEFKKSELAAALSKAGVEEVLATHEDKALCSGQDDKSSISYFDSNDDEVEVPANLNDQVDAFLHFLIEQHPNAGQLAGGNFIWDVKHSELTHSTYQYAYNKDAGWPKPDELKPVERQKWYMLQLNSPLTDSAT